MQYHLSTQTSLPISGRPTPWQQSSNFLYCIVRVSLTTPLYEPKGHLARTVSAAAFEEAAS